MLLKPVLAKEVDMSHDRRGAMVIMSTITCGEESIDLVELNFRALKK